MNQLTDKYFSILKDYFGEAVKIAAKHKYRPEKYLPKVFRNYSKVLLASMLDSMFSELIELDWKSQENLITNSPGLKVGCVGLEYDSLPHVSSISDFLRKTCLYADSMIVEDPALKQLLVMKQGKQITNLDFFHIVEDIVKLIVLEHLFESDSNTPICYLAPSSFWSMGKNGLMDLVAKLTLANNTEFMNELFSKNFSSIDDAENFLSEIKDDEEFFDLLGKNKVYNNYGQVFSSENLAPLKEYYFQSYGKTEDLGDFYESIIGSQNSFAITHLLYYGRLAATPTAFSQFYWNAVNWIIKNDNQKIFQKTKRKFSSKEVSIIAGLQQEDLKWLGNVPINKIKMLRERGELGDLRELLSSNIRNIKNASDEEFVEVGRQVKYNIEQAMRKHSADVKDLNEKYRRRYQLGVGSMAVAGTMGFVSAVFPPLALAAGIVSAIAGSGSIITAKDLLEKREKVEELKRKPVAMLFDAKKAS